MGYTTYIGLKVIEYDKKRYSSKEKAIVAFQMKTMESKPCDLMLTDKGVEFTDNNGNTIDAIVKSTKELPGILIEGQIDGTIEDSSDLRAIRIKEGKKEEVSARIFFPPFKKLLTSFEKKSSGNENDVKLELNEIETLTLLADKAITQYSGTTYETLYRTIHKKLVELFDKEWKDYTNKTTTS